MRCSLLSTGKVLFMGAMICTAKRIFVLATKDGKRDLR